MAHFAEIDQNNIVLRVVVVSNNELIDGDVTDSEAKGIAFCKSLFGGEWVQTSYNGTFRKNYAGIGFTWDAYRNAFIPPDPGPGYALDEETCRWIELPA